jgi:hypothetical protein
VSLFVDHLLEQSFGRFVRCISFFVVCFFVWFDASLMETFVRVWFEQHQKLKDAFVRACWI